MKRLDGLDALRGIAALSVLLYHVGNDTAVGFKTNAGLAVDFFFMLSGYVMARTYEPRLADGLSAGTFFRLRYLRLCPIMAFSFIVAAPAIFSVYGTGPAMVLAFALNLVLIPAPFAPAEYAFNIAAWSIFFELFANLIHGLVLWRVRTHFLLAGSFMVGLVILARTGVDPLLYRKGIGSFLFAGGFPRVCMTYLLGVALYRMWRDVPPFRIPPMVAFLAMPAMFGGTLVSGYNTVLLDLAFIYVACPLMIAGALQSHPWRLATKLGDISFPLYAIHMPVIASLRVLGLWVPLAIPLALVAAIAIERATQPAVRAWRRARQSLSAPATMQPS